MLEGGAAEEEVFRAAKVIQKMWRRHIDTQIYKYLKNLVIFRNEGDPRRLMHWINPREASILDAAAGVYLRFRLGGTVFPPNIYYKIFTHRPIVDMCASSPRDYTHPAIKRPLPRQVHNRWAVAMDDHTGWYRRTENNSWRLLPSRITQCILPVTLETCANWVQFHHSRIHRRQDIQRMKKRRKIEWLQKMYAEGILQVRTEHQDAALLVQESTQGMIAAVERFGPDHIVDWEVDELLEWTNALNFDEYISGWKAMGISRSSEFYTDKRLACSKSQLQMEKSQTVPYIHTSSQFQSDPSRANVPNGNM